jgi:hypothetical protein
LRAGGDKLEDNLLRLKKKLGLLRSWESEVSTETATTIKKIINIPHNDLARAQENKPLISLKEKQVEP